MSVGMRDSEKYAGKKIVAHVLIMVLVLSMLSVMIFASSYSASAGDTHTWDGGGVGALASTKENWVGDASAPEAGDAVVFDAGALACTWDLAITLASFTMSAGYSGTITIAS